MHTYSILKVQDVSPVHFGDSDQHNISTSQAATAALAVCTVNSVKLCGMPQTAHRAARKTLPHLLHCPQPASNARDLREGEAPGKAHNLTWRTCNFEACWCHSHLGV